MKKAFTYMCEDNKFWTKAVIYFVIALILSLCNQFITLGSNNVIDFSIVSFILLSLVAFFLSLITTGYKIANISALSQYKQNLKEENKGEENKVEKNKEEEIPDDENQNEKITIIPNIDITKNLFSGFQYSVAFLLLMLPACILPGVIYKLSWILDENSPITLLLGILSILAIIFFILYFIYFSIGYLVLYVKTPSWLVCYQFKELFKLALTKKYLIIALIVLLISFLSRVSVWGLSLITAKWGLTTYISVQCVLESIVSVYFFFVINYYISELLLIEEETIDEFDEEENIDRV